MVELYAPVMMMFTASSMAWLVPIFAAFSFSSANVQKLQSWIEQPYLYVKPARFKQCYDPVTALLKKLFDFSFFQDHLAAARSRK